MNTVRTLLWADGIALRRWFSTRTGSRLFVAGLFIAVFGMISYGLFTLSGVFFHSLASYERFGFMTAGYLIHAATIIILWLSIGSSVVAATAVLLSPGATLSWLMTLPIPPRRIVLWFFTKTVTANSLLMACIFTPVMLSFAFAFDLLTPGFIIRIILVFLSVVFTSAAVGMAVALLFSNRIRGHEYPIASIGILIFFVTLLGLLKLIFPPELALLSGASAEKFTVLYSALPLNHYMLPTAWLAGTIVNGFGIEIILMLLTTLSITCMSLRFQFDQFLGTLRDSKSQPFIGRISPFWRRQMLTSQSPLLIRNWLSISRLPSETGYGIFLASVAVFFFLFVSAGTGSGYRIIRYSNELMIFSFGWLAFFTVAFALRFLFPVMGGEGKNAWHIFTTPITRKKLLKTNVHFALLMSLGPMLLAFSIWQILPFASGYRLLFSTASVLIISFISVTQTLLGSLAPDFSRTNTPENASTSGMGLLTVGLSIVSATGGCYLLWLILLGKLPAITGFGILTGTGVLLVYCIYSLALLSIRRYELP